MPCRWRYGRCRLNSPCDECADPDGCCEGSRVAHPSHRIEKLWPHVVQSRPARGSGQSSSDSQGKQLPLLSVRVLRAAGLSICRPVDDSRLTAAAAAWKIACRPIALRCTLQAKADGSVAMTDLHKAL